jgi:hypothetical protein
MGQTTTFTATSCGNCELQIKVTYGNVTKYGSALINVTLQTPPDTITITGKVTDSAGKPIAGATVTLKATDNSYNATTKTDSKGVYVFKNVPANKTYIITITMPGYKDVDIKVTPGPGKSTYQIDSIALSESGFNLWFIIGGIAIAGGVGAVALFFLSKRSR